MGFLVVVQTRYRLVFSMATQLGWRVLLWLIIAQVMHVIRLLSKRLIFFRLPPEELF